MKRRYKTLVDAGKTSAEAMAIIQRESGQPAAAPNRAALALAALMARGAASGGGGVGGDDDDDDDGDDASGNASGKRRGCYCTLITSDDFLPGLLTMLHSLAKTAPACRDVVVLVTAQVSAGARARIQRAGAACAALSVRAKVVPAIPNPNASVHVAGWVNAGYTKLHVFNMTRFRKVVYIDADALVVENVDELFDRPGAPCPAAAPDVFPPDKFNAGVMVVEPSASRFADMRSKIDVLPSHDGGDTGFLNAYFPGWFALPAAHRLPFRFNAQRTMHWLTFAGNPGYWRSIRPVAILHFSSNPKPWTMSASGADKKMATSDGGAGSGSGSKKGELEMIWWHYFTESQMGMGANLLGPPPFEENLREDC